MFQPQSQELFIDNENTHTKKTFKHYQDNLNHIDNHYIRKAWKGINGPHTNIPHLIRANIQCKDQNLYFRFLQVGCNLIQEGQLMLIQQVITDI